MGACSTTWEYKLPVSLTLPRKFNSTLIQNDNFRQGVMSSKASGEPPLCVTPAATSAVRQCIQSILRDKLGGDQELPFKQIPVPFTSDRVLEACNIE
jgi:xanthine dehydrogenase/oxidase